MEHNYPFDPAYGHDLDALRRICPPAEPADFVSFWQARRAAALQVNPTPRRQPSGFARPGFSVEDIAFTSTGRFPLRAWLLIPEGTRPNRAFVVGHGYGGITQPDARLPCPNAAYLFLCFRGLACSARPPISSDPAWHVLDHIDDRDGYILGGCVEDVWSAVTAVEQLLPELIGHIGYMGISFSGGIGALALAWEPRIDRGHLNVPTFGHWPLRLQLPTIGSGASVQRYAQDHPHVADTLAYYDAAVAARYIRQPMHVAAALFDPAVAPPGQFAIYNAMTCEKSLFVLQAGHFDYPERPAQEQALLSELGSFFGCDESGISPLV